MSRVLPVPGGQGGFSAQKSSVAGSAQQVPVRAGRGSKVETYGKGTAAARSDAVPAVTVPHGGGIKSLDPAVKVNPATGSASLHLPVPLTTSPRWGTPDLSLAYNSGSGNGEFGVGWQLLGMPAVARNTAKGLPTYTDTDTFVLAGEELVPQLVADTNNHWHIVEVVREYLGSSYQVRRYRATLDVAFDRVERWTRLSDPYDIHWRTISSHNETQIFGRTVDSRVQADGNIFQWMLSEAYDSKGNAQLVEWYQEDGTNVDILVMHERNRSRSNAKLLKRIRYGNAKTNRDENLKPVLLDGHSKWLFEVVFDYGDHDAATMQQDSSVRKSWLVRSDPFSSYAAGFEIRTYRLCRRILMYHHFPDELQEQSTLVSSLDFSYKSGGNLSLLGSMSQSGYCHTNNNLSKRSSPPIEFQYSKSPSASELQCLMAQELQSSCFVAGSEVGTNVQWMDLYGDSTTGILAQQTGGWYYQRSLSSKRTKEDKESATPSFDARLGLPEELQLYPSLGLSTRSTSASFADIDGNGQLDLRLEGDSINGYCRGNRDTASSKLTWQPFKPFRSWPLTNLDRSDLRHIDMTGDGRADLLEIDGEKLIWYPSLGYDGYGSPRNTSLPQSGQFGVGLFNGESTAGIYLADMSGDGLADIVRICNNNICYWPNLGYGNFGQEVSMDSSPSLDRDDEFDHKRILLLDIDGSGTQDLLYFSSKGITLFYNNAGNSWSQGILLTSLLPELDSMSRVAAVDLLGTGTACIVYSTIGPDHAAGQNLRYVDLLRGKKPHLLAGVKDNQGLEITLNYRSASAFYLEDEVSGTPWTSHIPSPVHCVESMMQYDHVVKSLQTSRYRYHHGRYDSFEREFCGFGMVESWHKTSFAIAQARPDLLDGIQYQKPSYVKQWFHTGALPEYGRF